MLPYLTYVFSTTTRTRIIIIIIIIIIIKRNLSIIEIDISNMTTLFFILDLKSYTSSRYMKF